MYSALKSVLRVAQCAGYASDDDAAAMAAAVAASLDKQEGNQPTTSPPSHSPTESQRPYPGSHTSQDLAFLTDKPLLPPDSFYGSDGAASSTGRGEENYPQYACITLRTAHGK